MADMNCKHGMARHIGCARCAEERDVGPLVFITPSGTIETAGQVAQRALKRVAVLEAENKALKKRLEDLAQKSSDEREQLLLKIQDEQRQVGGWAGQAQELEVAYDATRKLLDGMVDWLRKKSQEWRVNDATMAAGYELKDYMDIVDPLCPHGSRLSRGPACKFCTPRRPA